MGGGNATLQGTSIHRPRPSGGRLRAPKRAPLRAALRPDPLGQGGRPSKPLPACARLPVPGVAAEARACSSAWRAPRKVSATRALPRPRLRAASAAAPCSKAFCRGPRTGAVPRSSLNVVPSPPRPAGKPASHTRRGLGVRPNGRAIYPLHQLKSQKNAPARPPLERLKRFRCRPAAPWRSQPAAGPRPRPTARRPLEHAAHSANLPSNSPEQRPELISPRRRRSFALPLQASGWRFSTARHGELAWWPLLRVTPGPPARGAQASSCFGANNKRRPKIGAPPAPLVGKGNQLFRQQNSGAISLKTRGREWTR